MLSGVILIFFIGSLGPRNLQLYVSNLVLLEMPYPYPSVFVYFVFDSAKRGNVITKN